MNSVLLPETPAIPVQQYKVTVDLFVNATSEEEAEHFVKQVLESTFTALGLAPTQTVSKEE